MFSFCTRMGADHLVPGGQFPIMYCANSFQDGGCTIVTIEIMISSNRNVCYIVVFTSLACLVAISEVR